MTALERATENAIGDARVKAEIAIEKILIALQHDTGRKVDRVDIDTRNFANYDCEIYFQDQSSR